MNREVQERIVAMYFDNDDFEKNAKKTIDTLGQLKDGLNLEGSAKGFNVFEKIGKTLNFDKANQGLTKMKSGITTIGEKFKKAFKIGQQPLNEAQGFLRQLQGYMTKYIGFDLAGKIVTSLENSIRSLTIKPISAGWNQYQSKMDSVKTIMSSTGESLANVNAELDSMTEYANKTIYSLTDMTSNLGKFTNNGVELNRAVKAMEGIANATADAGQGAQQASMAMYNISQAIGVGKMTTIDWKSLENANIATQKLKNTFLEMAALQGRIEKQTAKDGSITYMLTKDENGQALKSSIQLTAANFREYLSKGWLDKETMLRAFEVYSGTVDENTLESWGIHDTETKKRLMELGQQALESATQVRTFTKMMDALGESVQSGWAQTFELIFGNMEQGTTLWTNINNILDEVLSKSAEARNAILKVWAGEDQNVDTEKEQLEEKNKQLNNKKQYLDDLMKDGGPIAAVDNQLKETKDAIEKYQQEIRDLQKSDKPNQEKDRLIKKRQDKIRDLTKTQKQLESKRGELAKQEKVRAKQEEEAAGYEKEIETYKREIEQINKRNLYDIDGDVDPAKKKEQEKAVAERQKKIAELEKKLNKVNSQLGTDKVAQTKKEIADLEKEIDNLNKYIEDKTGHAKSEFVDEQGRSGRDIALDALYEIIGVFKELGGAVSEAFGNVFGRLDAEGLFNFTKKIGDAVHGIAEWFGKLDDEGSRINKLRKGLQGVLSVIKAVGKFIKVAVNLVSRIARPVIDWAVEVFGGFGKLFDGLGDLEPSEIIVKIGEKLKAAWAKIKEFFTPKALFDDKGNYLSTDIPVISWLNKLWGKVKDIVRDWAQENGFIKIYETVSEWWNKIRQSLGEARETLIDKWMEVKQWFIDSGIAQFFSDVWGWVTSLFQSKVVHGYRNGRLESWYSNPIMDTFNDLKDKVESAWNTLISWEGWKTIGNFASDTWNWIATTFGIKKNIQSGYRNGRLESWYEEAPVITWLNNIWKAVETFWNDTILTTARPIWEAIASFASDTWNWISSQFSITNPETGESQEPPIVTWLSGIWSSIETFWNEEILTRAKPVWEAIASFAGDTWNWILTTFGSKKTVQSGYRNGRLESWYAEAPVVTWITNIWESIKKTWESIRTWEGWEKISKFLGDVWGWLTERFEGIKNWVTPPDDGSKSGFAKFLESIGNAIDRAWTFITKTIPWEEIGKFLSGTWEFIVGLMGGGEGGDDGKNSGASKIAGRTRAAAGVVSDVSYNVNKISQETKKVDDPKITDKALEILTTVLKSVGDFFAKVFDAVKGVVITPELERFLGNMSDFLSGIMNIIGQIFGSIGRFATAITTGDWSKWGSLQDILIIAIPAVAGIIGEVVKYRNLKNLANVSEGFGQSFGLQFIEVCGGILMAAAALSLLTTLDQHKLDKAAQIMLVLGALIGGVIIKLSSMHQVQDAAKPMTGVERFFTNVINTIGKLGMLYIVVNALPSIIQAITDAKKSGVGNIGEDVLKICEGIAIVVGGISLVLALSEKITGGKGINPVSSISTALSIGAFIMVLAAFLDIIGGFVTAASQLGIDPNGEGQIEILENATKVITGIGTAIGGFFGAVVSAFAGQITVGSARNQMEATKQAAEVAATIDEDDLRAMTVVMKMLGALQDSLPDYDGILDKWLNGNKLEELGRQMPALGTGLSEFALKIKSITDEDIGKMQTSMRLISIFASAVQLISDALNPKDGDWMFGGGPKWNEAVFQKYLDAAGQLSAAIQKGMTENLNGDPTEGWTASGLTFNAMPIIDAIIEALKLGDTAIARAVHDMVQSGLDEINGENPKDYDRDPLTVNDNVIEKFSLVSGKLTGSNGETFDLNTIMQQILGDGTQWTGLMEEFDLKNDELGKKMNEFAKSMDFSSWMQTTDTETGEATDILSFLQSELTELGATLDTMEPLQVKITPVFDMTNMTPDKLQSALMANPVTLPININNGRLQMSFEGLGNELRIEEIISKLTAIITEVHLQGVYNTAAVNTLGSHMDGIANEVARMQLVLDTGALVGELTPRIDAELYNRSVISSRTGPVVTKPSARQKYLRE